MKSRSRDTVLECFGLGPQCLILQARNSITVITGECWPTQCMPFTLFFTCRFAEFVYYLALLIT